MVNLSKKSWHFWLYKQFFPTHQWTRIDNLCPYFWKVVLCVLIFPVSVVLAIPALVFMFFFMDPEDREPLGDLVGKGFAVWISLGLLISMISMFFSKNQIVDTFGFVGWAVIAVLLIGAGISTISSSLENRTTLVGEFMKAKKNKYCPKIEWREDEGTKVLQEEE